MYGEDFLTFGEFDKECNVEDEATLLKIFDENDEQVFDRHHFKFENSQVTYSRSVNGEQKDADIEHEIAPTQLS